MSNHSQLWELEISYFVPFIQKSVEELIKLLAEATTLEGKRYVGDTIGVIIERVEDKVSSLHPPLTVHRFCLSFRQSHTPFPVSVSS